MLCLHQKIYERKKHSYLCNIDSFSVFLSFFLLFPADIWSDQSFQTDPDLPPGWKKINDIAGIYYWHIPTGTTQWQRPVSVPTDLQGSRKGSLGSITPSPTPETEVTHCPVVCCVLFKKKKRHTFLKLQVWMLPKVSVRIWGLILSQSVASCWQYVVIIYFPCVFSNGYAS